MSNAITLNGVSYLIPDVGEGGWGEAVTDYLVALSTGVLAKSGGSFTLTANVDFGATYGIRSAFYTTRTADLASQGELRLARVDTLQWRNEGDTANLKLGVNSSNQLTFAGNPISSLALGAANTVLKVNAGGTDTEYGKLLDANIATTAAIDPDKLIIGAAGTFLYNAAGTSQSMQSFETILEATHTIGNLSSTGLVSGGDLSVDVDTTKFDLAAGKGQVVDNYTDPSNPVYTDVDWTAFNAQTVTNIGTQVQTFVCINSSGAIVQQSALPTSSELRDLIFIGVLLHPDLVNVAVASNSAINVAIDGPLATVDLSYAIGPINVNGNVFSANGANLNLNKSVGEGHLAGLNYHTDRQNPNRATIASSTAGSHFYSYQDGAGGFTIVALSALQDPAFYDDGTGTLAAVSTNQWTIQRISISISATVIEYGQNKYNSLSGALSVLDTETHNLNPALDGFLLRCFLVTRGGATDLSDTGDATFINAGKFGGQGANGGTSATTDLQNAYDNSTTPEIIVDGTRGALSIADANTPIAAPIFEVTNFSGGTPYFRVTTDGFYAGATHDTSAIIDCGVTTTKGFGNASMTTTQRDAISTPKTGLEIFNTSTGVLNVYDGSSWGAVGSGAGEINYIGNGDGESDTSGWATYANTVAGSTPDAGGTGGSPTGLTLTTQATTVLRGSKSFKLVKAAANHQGEGISYDFTIDSADRNKLLKFADVYNTDGTYTDEDIAFFIYDVTNGVLITPSDNGFIGVDKDGSSSGARTIGWASTDSLSYRAIFHITESTSNQYDLYFDDVIVGPGSVATGAVITAWENYTPTFTGFGTVTSINSQWRRVAENIEITGDWTGGSPTATEAQVTLPNGYTVDFKGSTSPIQVGKFYRDVTTTNVDHNVLATHGDTYINFSYKTNGGSNNMLLPVDANAFASTNRNTFTASIPVAEFNGSGTVNLMSDNVAAANVRAKYTMSGTTGAGDNVTYDFDTEVYNKGGAFTDNGAGIITYSGPTADYRIYAQTTQTTALDSGGNTKINVSGTTVSRGVLSDGGDSGKIQQCYVELELVNGATIEVRNNNSVAKTVGNDASETYLTISRIADYSAGQPTSFGLATATNPGLVKENKWQIRNLSPAKTAASADETTLRISNLTIGKTYKYTGMMNGSLTGNSVTENLNFGAVHDGVNLFNLTFRDDSGPSDTRTQTMSVSKIFKATATSVIVNLDIDGTGQINVASFSMIEEMDNYGDATTEFTP